MSELSIDTTDPSTPLGIDGVDRLCDECEHPAIIKPRRPSVLRRVFRMRPRPAECQVRVDDESALGTMPCGCRNAVHGS